MPIARYFIVVGSALAVLLLIVGWSLPGLPESFPDRPEIIERVAIRIRSEHKWPEKIVLDTTQVTIPTPSIEVAPTERLVARLPDEMTDQAGVDSLAKPNPDVRPIDSRRRPARKPGRVFPSTHVARPRNRNNPPSRKRVARRDPWIGWHFPEAN